MFSSKYYYLVLFIFLITFNTFSQDFFEDTWYGFKSGEYTEGRFPYTADIGDLNNDGYNDIVIGQFPLDAGFKVMMNNSDGTYSLNSHYTTIKGTQSIRIADFNNDNFNDVVVANSGTFNGFANNPDPWDYGNSISVFLNNGDGTLTEQPQVITALHPEGLEIGDFDNDGDTDIAVANYGANNVTILQNDGNSNFSTTNISVGDFPSRISAGYINDDELIDLVVATVSTNRCSILYNNGNGFDTPVVFDGNLPSNYNLGTVMDAIDIDNDGDDDIIFINSWGSSVDYVNIYKNDGNGNFSGFDELMYPAYFGSGDDCNYADLNNDGWLDIISGSFNGESGKGFFVFESDGSGGFLDVKTFTSGQASSDVLIDDFNQDGNVDVLIADNSMSVNVHLNNGQAEFPENNSFEIAGSSSEDIDAGDIDLDGDIDIVTSSDDGFETDVSVLLNNGDGTFADYFVIPRSGDDQGGAHAKIRDLNGDNYPDVVFLSPTTNLQGYIAFVAFNNQNGGFGSPVSLQVESCGWGDVEAVDIDNDNDLDLVMTEFLACMGISESGRRIYFMKNNGDGTFQDPYIKVIGYNPESITTGDYNQDGNIDIAVANYGPYGSRNYIQIMMGDGAGNFSNPDTYTVGQGPHDITTSDFNNDDILDLATGNNGADGTGGETMSVLLGNGNGTFQNAVTYDAPYSSQLLGNSGVDAVDVDHDGDNDILLANQGGGDLAVYINDGNGNFEHLYRTGVKGYGPRGIAPADYNGDNITDLAVISAAGTGFINQVNILKGIGEVVPVELSSFSANINEDNIILTWITSTETNNSHFAIQKSFNSLDYETIGTVEGKGSTTQQNYYSFEDNDITSGKRFYRLKQVDYDGTFSYSKIVEVETGVPVEYNLSQNYPNPFNPSTTIEYRVAEKGNVKLIIYNSLGETVKTLVNETKEKGSYKINFDASNLASGFYIYQLQVNDFIANRKMILMK